MGSGAFGHVFSAQCKKTNNTVAMKVIYKNTLENRPKAKESLLREIGVCQSLKRKKGAVCLFTKTKIHSHALFKSIGCLT